MSGKSGKSNWKKKKGTQSGKSGKSNWKKKKGTRSGKSSWPMKLDQVDALVKFLGGKYE